jgi:dsRNA-specific ribonuclease
MEQENKIAFGVRGDKFRDFIQSLLTKGRLKQQYINYLTDKDAMDLYAQAFTNPTADSATNYEFFEKLGDSTCNKIITWYIYRKYPKLSTKPQGVMILTRLSHLMRSTEIFSSLALRLGFEEFISVGYMLTVKKIYEPVMKVKRTSVLEDCFEAFFGVTEFILDSRIKEGVGYAICNLIFKAILDEIKSCRLYNTSERTI